MCVSLTDLLLNSRASHPSPALQEQYNKLRGIQVRRTELKKPLRPIVQSWRPSTTILLALACAIIPSSGQSQPHASMRSLLNSQTPPDRVKDLLFATILTTCPVPGSASPTTFFYDEKSLWGHGRQTLFEYRSAWNQLYPDPLTEADKLNGIQFKGPAVLGAPAFRYLDGRRWSSWEERG